MRVEYRPRAKPRAVRAWASPGEKGVGGLLLLDVLPAAAEADPHAHSPVTGTNSWEWACGSPLGAQPQSPLVRLLDRLIPHKSCPPSSSAPVSLVYYKAKSFVFTVES